MDGVSKAGRIIFSIAMAFFGVQCLSVSIGAHLPPPGPPWTQHSASLAIAAGTGLLLTAFCITLLWQARMAAVLLAAGILLRALIIYLPPLFAHLRDPGPWTSGFELLGLGGAALVLFADLPPPPAIHPSTASSFSIAGRILFALSLVVFGVQHWIYGQFVATLVPAWIPWHLFWAYAIGIAFFVAAIGLLLRSFIRPVAILLAIMFLLWVVILHAPRVASSPRSGDEWTSAAVALAMGGASLIIAAARPAPSA